MKRAGQALLFAIGAISFAVWWTLYSLLSFSVWGAAVGLVISLLDFGFGSGSFQLAKVLTGITVGCGAALLFGPLLGVARFLEVVRG